MSRRVRTTLVWLVLLAGIAAVLVIGLRAPYATYAVRTGSMSPTIPPRSAVVVHEGEYAVGQVVSFRHDGGVITHRLLAVRADGTVVTQGDANRSPDPFTVRVSDIVGGVVAAPQHLGYWLVFLKNPAGLASVLLGLTAIVLIWSATSGGGRAGPRREATMSPCSSP